MNLISKKHVVLLLVGTLIIWCVSCGDSEPKDATTEKENQKAQNLKNGISLLEQNCFSCHSPNPEEQNRIAPTMQEVKMAYLENRETNETRIAAMVDFLENPEKENALMSEAVEEYGLMAKMDFSKDEYRQMATSIFESEMEKPEWYANQYGETASKRGEGDDSRYLKIGKDYALQAKGVLGKNLMRAISEKGPHGAVSFCNIEAYPLTDSVAVSVNAFIRRASDRPRNPENMATERELHYITSAKADLKESGEAKPKIQLIDGQYVGYYPITTQAMCLKCHGTPEKEVDSKTLAVLQELYPYDEATGYGLNELRGIWVVKMEKE